MGGLLEVQGFGVGPRQGHACVERGSCMGTSPWLLKSDETKKALKQKQITPASTPNMNLKISKESMWFGHKPMWENEVR